MHTILSSRSPNPIANMVQTETLLSDYVNFDDQNVGLSGGGLMDKELTFCAAAAVSRLCEEQENGINPDESLYQKEEFKFIRNLDLISAVYATASISKQKEIKSTPPILAWSNRLQTVFLGISCTRDLNDPKLNWNVQAQAADAVGSRFYQGLIDRSGEIVPLIECLMRQYKVVVCGHSFGGALATASSYLAIFDHQSLPNAWEGSQPGISVITFGSPSCHFAEPQGTSTSWKMHLSRNFHHVINPHDYVPFALNDASRRFKQNLNAIRTPLETISPTIKMFWPIFENCLDFLLEKKGKFCHFGCMYSIATEVPGIQNCLQIRSLDDLPQIPGAREVDEYHKMSHYFHCVKGSIGARLPQEILSESHREITSDEFPSAILPMPVTVKNCSCVVENDRLIVSFNVTTTIFQYLVKETFFRKGEREIPLVIVGCLPHPDDQCLASVEFEYIHESNEALEHIGKVSIAIQQGIVLRDIFGRSTTVQVDTVKYLSLDKASQPETFESIRLAMIRALVAQTSKVQGIRTRDARPDAHTPENVTQLDEKVRFVVNRIDSLVSDASPHLVVSQIGHAFKILKTRWPRDFETDKDFSISVPGQWQAIESDAGLLRDVPSDCPRVLRKLITDMFKSQRGLEITQAATSLKAWTAAKRPTLAQQFTNVPTFAHALEKFSHDLYHRSTDQSKRTEQATSQFQDIMGVIQLCHLIIITQLDAPYEWYCTSTAGRQKTSAALGVLPSYVSWSTAPALFETIGLSALYAPWLAAVGGLGAMYYSYHIINHFLHRHSKYLDLSFPGVLAITLQALGLPPAETGDMVEKTLLDHVEEDILTSRTPETLEKWRLKLEKGLEDYPGAKKNQWSIIPDQFWSRWLFTVAQVAKLRIQLLDKICIGVQGSTEAGKSQMLTVLTGASKDHFKPGSGSLCRTLGIQSYNASELGAIFLDSPGFDDQIPQIKYMADVFQELFAIVIIVIPMQRTRSEATESALDIAIKMLLNRDDKRPLRILLSQADGLDFHRNDKEVFRATLHDVRDQLMTSLRKGVGENFTSFRQQRFSDGIVYVPETLEDIVKPFSTHAQMNLDGIRALSDCGSKYSCKIERASHFENLCELADGGEIWDIESLRSWLRELSPNSVPMSRGRVRKYRD